MFNLCLSLDWPCMRQIVCSMHIWQQICRTWSSKSIIHCRCFGSCFAHIGQTLKAVMGKNLRPRHRRFREALAQKPSSSKMTLKTGRNGRPGTASMMEEQQVGVVYLQLRELPPSALDVGL